MSPFYSSLFSTPRLPFSLFTLTITLTITRSITLTSLTIYAHHYAQYYAHFPHLLPVPLRSILCSVPQHFTYHYSHYYAQLLNITQTFKLTITLNSLTIYAHHFAPLSPVLSPLSPPGPLVSPHSYQSPLPSLSHLPIIPPCQLVYRSAYHLASWYTAPHTTLPAGIQPHIPP